MKYKNGLFFKFGAFISSILLFNNPNPNHTLQVSQCRSQYSRCKCRWAIPEFLVHEDLNLKLVSAIYYAYTPFFVSVFTDFTFVHPAPKQHGWQTNIDLAAHYFLARLGMGFRSLPWNPAWSARAHGQGRQAFSTFVQFSTIMANEVTLTPKFYYCVHLIYGF